MSDGLMKVLVGVLGGALLVLLLFGGLSGGGMTGGYGGPGHMTYGGMMGWGPFGASFSLVPSVALLGLVAALVAWIVRRAQRS
jgi:hypothetical protein